MTKKPEVSENHTYPCTCPLIKPPHPQENRFHQTQTNKQTKIQKDADARTKIGTQCVQNAMMFSNKQPINCNKN